MSIAYELVPRNDDDFILETHAVLSTVKSAGDDEVLYLLSHVRRAIARSKAAQETQTEVVRALTEDLIDRGVYPKETVEANPNSVLRMVEGWGAYWHVYSGVLNCPHCSYDLRDHRLGPPFKLELGHYNTARDCTDYHSCPHCKQDISRTHGGAPL